ncbi:hypothetical protein EC142370_00869 [Escherichia coli O145:H34]|nr:hypothetical protein EC142370_00869 [Escherichia coli O145:H34]
MTIPFVWQGGSSMVKMTTEGRTDYLKDSQTYEIFVSPDIVTESDRP